MGAQEIKLTFLGFFNNPLSKYLIFKRVFCINWLFCAIKITRGLRLVLVHNFFHKNCPYLILYQLTKCQYQTFYASQDIKEHVFKGAL